MPSNRRTIPPQYKLIYRLFKKKLKEIRKYINENLKKEFIKSFILLIEYFILFVLKVNGKLRLCINY